MYPIEKSKQLNNFEILFKDSPEYFAVAGAKMLVEGPFVRFICFDPEGKFKQDLWYPIENIFRIKRVNEG